MGNCLGCRSKNGKTKFRNLSKAEKQEERNDLEDFRSKTKQMIAKANDTVTSLREAADYLDKVWKNCKVVNASATSAGIVGGLLTIGGGIATITTAGAAAPLLIAGFSVGVAGAGTNVITSIIEAAITSSEIKNAEKDLKETLDNVNKVDGVIQEWMNTKDKAKFFYICCLATRILGLEDCARKILQELVLPGLTLPSSVVKAGEIAFQVGQAGTAGGQAAVQAGVQGSSAVAEAGVDAGSKAAAKGLGKLIIGVSAVFVVLDVIHLGFTITDLVQDQGSGAAKFLREKADELEKGILEQSIIDNTNKVV